jgi:hypothetical protein
MSLTPKNVPLAAIVATLAMSMTGCRAVAGIFKAGVWTGVIVIGFLLLLGFGATRLFARRT